MTAQLGDDDTKPAEVAQRMRALGTQADAFAADLEATRFERAEVKALSVEFATYSRNAGRWAKGAAVRFDRVAELLPQVEQSGHNIKDRMGALSFACERAPSGQACAAITLFKRLPRGPEASDARAFEASLGEIEREASSMGDPSRADVLAVVDAFRKLNQATIALRQQSEGMATGGPSDKDTQALEAKANKLCGARSAGAAGKR